MAVGDDLLDDMTVSLEAVEEEVHDGDGLVGAARASGRGYDEFGSGARGAEDVPVCADAGLERSTVIDRDAARWDDLDRVGGLLWHGAAFGLGVVARGAGAARLGGDAPSDRLSSEGFVIFVAKVVDRVGLGERVEASRRILVHQFAAVVDTEAMRFEIVGARVDAGGVWSPLREGR